MRQAWLGYSCRLLLAATLAASCALPATAAAPSKKRSTPSSSSSTSKAASAPQGADFNAGRMLLASQEAYATARKHFGAKRHDDAIEVLEIVIRDLNTAIVSTKDKRIRTSSGDLLRKAGSLKLAAEQARMKSTETAGSTTAPSTPTPGTVTPVAPDPAATLAPDSAVTAAAGTTPAIPLPPVAPAPAPAIPLPVEDDLDEESLGPLALDDDPNAIEIESHPRVDKWLDYFTGRGRPVFERWLVRSGLYMNWMKGILEREGVPTDLVHLVFVESGFNPHARSYASAVGPWQFIRGTARIFGLTVNSWVDERKDPEASTVAAARYLKHLHGLFNSWPLALASYNAGEGAVINAIKRQGTKDFWSLRLPQQTKDYVPKFMAVLAISRDPARYGFDTDTLEQPMTYDEVTIPGPVDLRALASACAVEVETIRLLNPSILKNAAPAKNDMVTIRVPDGSGDKLLASLAEGTLELPKVETPADPIVLRHKVRRGESLKSLSLKYGVPAKTIARYNRLGGKSRLKVGRTVLIPQDGALSRPGVRAGAKVAAKAAPDAASGSGGKIGIGVGSAEAGEAPAATKTIRVRKGQTLSGIAVAYGTTVSALRDLNGLTKRSVVKAGQRLKVPRAG